MAHMARAAGTDYAVAGGKTLIDGTAYSVVATREVENTVVIDGSAPSDQVSTLTISDSRFDWDNYEIREIMICGAHRTSDSDNYFSSGAMFGAEYRPDDSVNSVFTAGSSGYSISMVVSRLVVTATTNGQLTLGLSKTGGVFFKSVNYTIVLEAKA